MSGDKKIKVLVAKPGLDGHDRGAKTVVHALRDAGLDVVYTGLHKTPQQIVAAAVEHGVQVIGLSVLSGAHLTLTEQTVAEMKKAGIDRLPLMVGGVIPERDVEPLRALGARGVFPVDTPYDDIVRFVKDNCDG